MVNEYRPKGDLTSDEAKPPKFESAIQDPKDNLNKKKSAGEFLDEISDNPQLIMAQVNKIVAEKEKKLKEVTNKNKQLEIEKIKKDNQIEYLSGKIDGMEYVIEHLIKEE